MGTTHPIFLPAILLGSALNLSMLTAAPTTQPSAKEEIPATAPTRIATTQEFKQPATATVAATQAATQPATAPAVDPKAVADKHQKELLEQWRKGRRQLRAALKDRWTNAPIVQTFKPQSLINLSVTDGLLCADAVDLGTLAASRVAVEGSSAIWTVSSPNHRVGMPAGVLATSYVSITRFDFGGTDSDYWQTRLMVSGSSLTLFAQDLLGNATIFQTPGMIVVRVSESREMGQAPQVLFETRATSLKQLRSENPAEFRSYVLPLLTKFAEPTLMQPGPADVYAAFIHIPADPKIVHEIELLAPNLDSDDPDERDAASARLNQLGVPGVLAALRFDDANLSYEQKIRLRSFVAGYHRRAWMAPGVAERDLSFLIDCLEYDDPAVRTAAKLALEKQARHDIEFDVSLPPAETAKAADALRKQLLGPPPPAPAGTQPATQPAPQA